MLEQVPDDRPPGLAAPSGDGDLRHLEPLADRRRVMLAGMPARPLVPDRDGTAVPVGEYLDRQVELLRQAHDQGDRLAARVMHATVDRKATPEELLASPLTLEVARDAIARDHHYADWASAQAHPADLLDADFEAACDAIQSGEVDALRALLDARPERCGPAPRSPTARCCSTTWPRTGSRSSGSFSRRRTRSTSCACCSSVAPTPTPSATPTPGGTRP